MNGDPGLFSVLIDGNTVAFQQLFGFSSPHEVLRGALSAYLSLSTGNHVFEVLVERNSVAGGVFTSTEYGDDI